MLSWFITIPKTRVSLQILGLISGFKLDSREYTVIEGH